MVMMRGSHRNVCGFGLVVFMLMLLSAGCAEVQTTGKKAAETRPAVAPEVVTVTVPGTCSMPAVTPYYPPPDKIDLCGEPVPLESQSVQERFDREFTLVVYNHAQVYLWLKRMERYFPWIEERLRYYGLPEDLKYVAIVESDLMPDVCSPKGAAGPWQFMPSTGSAYGLEQRGSMDKRYDFEKATDSAFRFLQDLHKRYRSWSVVLAAYNCGDKRILDEMRSQGVRDYYHLKLPLETERYVMRVLAIKAVLGNPGQYGYCLPKGMGYQELRLDRVNVNFSRPVPIQTVAGAAGITYREFKRLNPVFRSEEVPAGPQELKLPGGTGKVFEQNFAAGRTQTVQPAAPASSLAAAEETDIQSVAEPARPAQSRAETKAAPVGRSAAPKSAAASPKVHQVKKGDTLSGVAKRYSVSVQDLRQANKIKGNDITPGQKLRIPSR